MKIGRWKKNCFSVELWMSRMVWSIQYATNTPRMFKNPARKTCLHRIVTPSIIVQQNTIHQEYWRKQNMITLFSKLSLKCLCDLKWSDGSNSWGNLNSYDTIARKMYLRTPQFLLSHETILRNNYSLLFFIRRKGKFKLNPEKDSRKFSSL